MLRTLNLGILAHVDAGKTSLTERLLHVAGVIDEIGSVDEGSTRTDSLALERQRGITIKSAVVSFVSADVTVNLIDTPGHPDFIAEVERVLNVLDGVVLVVSAVEGVQAQTRVLMRTLQRLRIPTVIFVNKIDRTGARSDALLRSMAERLTPAIVPMGSVSGLGTRTADYVPYNPSDPGFRARLLDQLSRRDDALLTAYVEDDNPIPYRRLRGALAAQSRRALVHPVFFGSAITGAGVDALVSGVRELLPAAEPDADGPVSGVVFKVDRGVAGEKVAYVRMFAGTLRTRDRVRLRRDKDAKVTAISVFDQGGDDHRTAVPAGRIAKVWGLSDVRIADPIGEPRNSATDSGHFAPPTLETVVVPCRPADKGALHTALVQLAEQDPLINLRQDDVRQETSVRLYGEVQKEVIQATLADEFGIAVTFRETTTVCIERPAGTGAAVEVIGEEPNPFPATIGLRVEPAATGAGVVFRLGVELGSMPAAYFKAVEETVRDTFRQGLHGWEVTDCTVTMTQSGYISMSSTAGDFRNLTPLVLMEALARAGTTVYEPMHRFSLEVPADVLGSVLPMLGRLGATPRTTAARNDGYLLEGSVPAARVHQLEQQLPALTRGEGVLECAFDGHQPVRGPAPARPRSDHNPLNRREYLLRVVRRVAGRG